MAIPAGEPVFLDTNILIYANVATAPLHSESLKAVLHLWEEGHPLWISRQVLREYAAVLTRPQTFSTPQDRSVIIERIHFFTTHFKVADDDAYVTAALLNLLTDYKIGGKQVHDANIVATMFANGIKHLLTHNVSDFTRYRSQIEVFSLEDTLN